MITIENVVISFILNMSFCTHRCKSFAGYCSVKDYYLDLCLLAQDPQSWRKWNLAGKLPNKRLEIRTLMDPKIRLEGIVP